MVASRCFQRGNPSDHWIYNIRAWKKKLAEATDPLQLDYTCRQVIMFYTRGELTSPGDKLVALSGLAKDWGQLRGFPASSYLAGLWRPHLPYYLCWFSMSNLLSSRPASYRAPTWSWASIDGQIQPSGQVFHSTYNPVGYAQVIAQTTTTLADGSLDDYGPISDAFLRMRVHMCALQTAVDIESLQGDGWDWRTSSREGDEDFITICWDEKSQDLAPRIPEGELYLSVVLGWYALEGRTLLDRLNCLILQATDDKPGQYRRVGHLITLGPNLSRKLLDDAASTVLGESLYLETDEGRKYTIEIV
jgi:hypothetical protein